MIHVNGLIAYHVEVYLGTSHAGTWQQALICYPPYQCVTEVRNFLFFERRVLVITNPTDAERIAYERAVRHMESINRRDRVRVVKVKTRDMQPERTVVYERKGSLL